MKTVVQQTRLANVLVWLCPFLCTSFSSLRQYIKYFIPRSVFKQAESLLRVPLMAAGLMTNAHAALLAQQMSCMHDIVLSM